MAKNLTTAQGRRFIAAGKILMPIMGRPIGQQPVIHAPRTQYDPKPWTDGHYRYHAWELTPEEP